MSQRPISFACVLSFSLFGCVDEPTTEPVAPILSTQSSSLASGDELDDGRYAPTPVCRPYDECPGDESDCVFLDVERDCGGPFCIEQAGRCDGGPGTFQHVAHWYWCYSPTAEDNYCYQSYIGRYLLHCGC